MNEDGADEIDNAVGQEGAAGPDQRLQVEVRFGVEEAENSGGKCDDAKASGSERLGHHLGRQRKSEASEADVEDKQVQNEGHCRHPEGNGAVTVGWNDQSEY